MNICVECVHYRDVRPASQLLGRAFESTDAAVSDALVKIVEDEQKVRDAEAEFKRAQASTQKTWWATRPVMSDFCGFGEVEGKYYIAEIKNADGECKDFAPGKPDRKACDDCAHKVSPTGPSDDARREQVYVDTMAKNIVGKVQQDTTQSELDAYRKGIASRQALELSGVYQTKGSVLRQPEYLAYCDFFSDADRFVVCLFQNAHHTCQQWQPAQEASEMSSTDFPTASAGPATVLPPVIGAPPAAPVAVPAPAASPDEVLVDGPTPLTRDLIGKIHATFEWLLGVQLPPDVRQQVEAAVVRGWQQDGPAEIQGFVSLVQAYESVVAQGPDVQEMTREQFQPQIVAGLRAIPEPAWAAVVALYDAANPPIASGQPPLTREVADAYLGVLSFVDALMENRQWTPMPEQTKTVFAQQMATSYPTLTPAQQAWLATLPFEWARTRVVWVQMSESDRTVYAEQLMTQFGAVAEATPLLAEDSAPTPPVIGGATPPPTAPGATGVAPGDKTTDQLLDEILTQQQEEEAKLEKEDPQQAMQVKLQNQLMNATMLSNMMKMRHDASMTIAGNIV